MHLSEVPGDFKIRDYANEPQVEHGHPVNFLMRARLESAISVVPILGLRRLPMSSSQKGAKNNFIEKRRLERASKIS